MCGILGIVDLPGHNPGISPAMLDEMRDTMADRGPDGVGVYGRGPVRMAHRRLAIRDHEAGNQPWVDGEPPVAVVFNGEIYNDHQLRTELRQTGARFESRCDTEVIPAAYRRWGIDCVQHLRGMFAFGLYDFEKQRLLLARDRFGIKPLYFAPIGTQIVFASSPAAILRHPKFSLRMNLRVMSHYLSTLRLTLGRETLYEGIFTLLPAERLVFEDSDVRIDRYWNYPQPGSCSNEEYTDAVDQLEESLSTAIKEQLQSDVPVGMFLSGGLDSNTMSSFVRDHHNGSLPAVCGVGQGIDEDLQFAERCAKHVDAELNSVQLSAESYREHWEQLVGQFALPLSTPTDLVIARISSELRKSATVTLGGEGADELLFGYDAVYHGSHDFDRLREIQAGTSDLGTRAERVFLKSLRQWCGDDQFQTPVEHYFAANSLIAPAAKVGLYRPEIWDAVGRDQSMFDWYGEYFSSDIPTTNGYAYLLHEMNLEALLSRLDRATMSVGLEARVPYADERVVEHAFALPEDFKTDVDPVETLPYLAAGELKARGSLRSKKVLRAVARHRLPADLSERPKASFPTPVGEWLSGPWAGWAGETIKHSPLLQEVFQPESLHSIAEHVPALGMKVWPLVNLAIWSDQMTKPRAA
ncbi:asparagine synthase (glutamine-hydrolyzing) [Calycomorphotria hydatis]|uniref:asparagine synthase (glutamine-hydrolyzing) n=1 Tax=Calycomorphotria hydatis TaxID=2528027 RepID=A0A517TCB2_9PLAN|nr:asparagine synthase (glutamine-hydrolyzing) [Calycomorphotria hydatis]QDT66018.1 Asparagine synthetase [glutamine-hydrolyzing] 1 [Calycomorphotria hydatis]